MSTTPAMLMKQPFTPIRRFFPFQAKSALGKRNRQYPAQPGNQTGMATAAPSSTFQRAEICLSSSFNEDGPTSSTLNPNDTLSDYQAEQIRGRLAIQQDDDAMEAVIITTLPSYPFCCHEDLITMTRGQLVEVATKLNARLPSVYQIPCGMDVSTPHIRHAIEVLVGIVPGTAPGAPKMVRAREPMVIVDAATADLRGLPSSPTRRLALSRKGKGNGRKMERLTEEEEEIDLFKLLEGPVKKRRI